MRCRLTFIIFLLCGVSFACKSSQKNQNSIIYSDSVHWSYNNLRQITEISQDEPSSGIYYGSLISIGESRKISLIIKLAVDTLTKKAQSLIKNDQEKKALHKMQQLLAQR